MIEGDTVDENFTSLSPKLLVVLLLGLLEYHVALLIFAAQSSGSVVGSTFWTLPDRQI